MVKQHRQIIQVVSVQKAIQEFASDTITPLIECDFELHGLTTYIKTAGMEAFGKFTPKLREHYQDREKLINDRVVFRQMYRISLFKKRECAVELEYQLEKGPAFTHPILHIEPTSHFPFQQYKPQELFNLIIKEINKIKARHMILIGLFSEPMIEDVKRLIKLIYTKKFTETFSILLFNGIEPEMARASELILHYEKKNKDQQIKEVEVGELIVEYIKPAYGKNGLNAYGKPINAGHLDNTEFLKCQIDEETIEKIDKPDRILLVSKKKGFVLYDKASISIGNKMTLNQVKRVQSQVAREEKNEVELVIKQDDINEDTVGEGVHLTSETIHINGYVAHKAVLEAKHLFIDGATHNGAKLFAKDASINRHKGILRCHQAQIKLLEGGEVHATNVTIDNALGGTVYGENVTVKSVRHNLKVFATRSITIHNCRGEDNLFKIDYKEVPVILSRLNFLQEDLDTLRYQLEEAKRHRETDVPKINAKINALKTEIDDVKQCAFNATVTIQEPVNGINQVVFVLPKNQELTFRTRDNTQYEPFHVRTTETRAILEPVGIYVDLD